MSIQHLAVFALLGAGFVGWTIYAKRREAERERQREAAARDRNAAK